MSDKQKHEWELIAAAVIDAYKFSVVMEVE
jgi:hypothetical protein